MCLLVSYKKKIWKISFFASLKSLKKEVEFGVGSGGTDPDPHQNVTDPQHCSKENQHSALQKMKLINFFLYFGRVSFLTSGIRIRNPSLK